jgi:hypothetical protein
MYFAPSNFVELFSKMQTWATGSGCIYKQSGVWQVQFYQNEKNAAGELVQVRSSKKLCCEGQGCHPASS